MKNPIDLEKILNEVGISIPKPYMERLNNLIDSCFMNGNFFILPKKKITKITNLINKTIYWEGVIVNVKGKISEIQITSYHLSNGGSFESLITNKEGYYIEGEKGYSQHNTKKNTLSQKKLIDFICSIEGIVKNIDEYNKIGYIDEDTIIYSNGILDLKEKKFVEKNMFTKPNTQLIFNNYSKKYDLVESSIGLSTLFDDLIQNEMFRFIVKGFFVSSIFRSDFYKFFKSFPLFQIGGLRGKGKTYFLRLLSNIVGFTESGITSISSSTPYVLKKQIDEVNFFNFMDESHKIDKKSIELLKGNYDSYKQKRGSLSRDGVITIETDNESVLCFCGESIVGEEALQTRCIIHNFKQNDIKELSNKEELSIIKNGNNFFQTILLNKKDINIIEIIKRGMVILDNLTISKEIEKRMKNNLLIIICGNLILNDGVDDEKFSKLINDYIEKNSDNVEETISYNIIEDIINKFSSYSSLLNYQKDSKIPLIYVSNKRLYLNFREIVKYYIKKSIKFHFFFIRIYKICFSTHLYTKG